MNTLNLGIIIPLFNEDENISELTDWITKVMDRNRIPVGLFCE